MSEDIPWDTLVERIAAGACTPFLGAGVSTPHIPNAAKLAERLADKWDYPMADRSDLMRVAQYRATMRDAVAPKEEICKQIKKASHPKFTDQEPHFALAELALPLYLTTNYDHFMSDALKHAGRSNVVRDICRWNSELLRKHDSYLAANTPDRDNPVVFHLHGHVDFSESLVVTEDDYLDFMVNVQDKASLPQDAVLPPRVEEALADTSLLFIGYGLRDWNLRVLLRALVAHAESTGRRISVSVQLSPTDQMVRDEDSRERAIEFLQRYFEALSLSVYWGSANEFIQDLREARTKFTSGSDDGL